MSADNTGRARSELMPAKVKFTIAPVRGDRVYYVSEEDVRIVLGRLPAEVCGRLRAIHFNDRGWRRKSLGYVTDGHREITLCALPPRIRLTARRLKAGAKPEDFGARPECIWPTIAIRRLMLYDVLLHEIGHLQIINENRRSERLLFAREKLAEEFALSWRNTLWRQRFAHPDPVHNPPDRTFVG